MSFGSRSLPPPTAEEVLRWARIKETRVCAATGWLGHVEIHHLLSAGGLRLGHRYTVGLEPATHAIVKTREFKEMWPNQRLLDVQDEMICWERAEIPARPERKRKSRCTASSKTVKRPTGGFAP